VRGKHGNGNEESSDGTFQDQWSVHGWQRLAVAGQAPATARSWTRLGLNSQAPLSGEASHQESICGDVLQRWPPERKDRRKPYNGRLAVFVTNSRM
jgi:hypothetical protein